MWGGAVIWARRDGVVGVCSESTCFAWRLECECRWVGDAEIADCGQVWGMSLGSTGSGKRVRVGVGNARVEAGAGGEVGADQRGRCAGGVREQGDGRWVPNGCGGRA